MPTTLGRRLHCLFERDGASLWDTGGLIFGGCGRMLLIMEFLAQLDSRQQGIDRMGAIQ